MRISQCGVVFVNGGLNRDLYKDYNLRDLPVETFKNSHRVFMKFQGTWLESRADKLGNSIALIDGDPFNEWRTPNDGVQKFLNRIYP